MSVLVFGGGQEAEFQGWVSAHPRGVILNVQRQGSPMLHGTRCSHVTYFAPRDVPVGSWAYVSNGLTKTVADDVAEMDDHIASRGLTAIDCTECLSKGLRAPVAAVGPPPANVGCVIRIREGAVEEVVHLVAEIESWHDDQVIPLDSALGRALGDAAPGDEVIVDADRGPYVVTVVAVDRPHGGRSGARSGVAARRIRPAWVAVSPPPKAGGPHAVDGHRDLRSDPGLVDTVGCPRTRGHSRQRGRHTAQSSRPSPHRDRSA